MRDGDRFDVRYMGPSRRVKTSLCIRCRPLFSFLWRGVPRTRVLTFEFE